VISQRFGRQLKREESAIIENMDEEDLATLARFKAEKAAARAAAAKEATAAAAAAAAAAAPAPAPATATATAASARSEFLPVGADV